MYGNVLVVFGLFWGGLGYFEAVGFQKRNLAHDMYGDGLVVFGVFWVGLGYFEAVGFQKRNLAHYMYGDALVWFWVVWGVSMDHTTAMLTDQIRKQVCLALIGSPTDSRTVLPRAVG